MLSANTFSKEHASKTTGFLRLFVFINLAYFRNILALLDKVIVSEVCMTPNRVIRAHWVNIMSSFDCSIQGSQF